MVRQTRESDIEGRFRLQSLFIHRILPNYDLHLGSLPESRLHHHQLHILEFTLLDTEVRSIVLDHDPKPNEMRRRHNAARKENLRFFFARYQCISTPFDKGRATKIARLAAWINESIHSNCEGIWNGVFYFDPCEVVSVFVYRIDEEELGF